ncbi:hypothetical protein P7L86_22765 [Vibrio parahaemolyticus]|nr:hypothetical protein [Vibrio parahaemolyticus]
MRLFFVAGVLICSSAYAASQVSMDDSFALNAQYNAERCIPVFEEAQQVAKAAWAKATVSDVSSMMKKKYSIEILNAEKLAFESRVSKQSNLRGMCENLYDGRHYLY